MGKSTLIGALTAELRKADREVAVLSIDPSSPFTRGALLGDRIRLSDHFLDPGVFIRSMASRGALGGLSEAALQVALVMDAAGKDDVLIETVGVGQAEIDIVDHADTIVLALMPGSGDSIQALKAGVMEIPDIIVVNKADHPMTETMVREVRGVLALSHDPGGWRVPILRTEAVRGEGVEELAEKIDEHRAYIEAAGTLARSAAPATCAARCSGSRRRACAAASRRRSPRTPRPRSCWSGWCGGSSTRRPPRRAAWRPRPMAERAPPSSSREEAIGWVGAPSSMTIDGEAVGAVQSVFFDSTSQRRAAPGWSPAARPRRGRRRGDPAASAPARRGRVWVAHRRQPILRSAPVVDPTRPLLREHELAICAHFGIGERGRPRRRGGGARRGRDHAIPPRP